MKYVGEQNENNDEEPTWKEELYGMDPIRGNRMASECRD